MYVSQMNLSSIKTRRNKAPLKRKELKRDERTIQAYLKYPSVLMVMKSGERSYPAYAEF